VKDPARVDAVEPEIIIIRSVARETNRRLGAGTGVDCAGREEFQVGDVAAIQGNLCNLHRLNGASERSVAFVELSSA
jgi:hypothetical protein